MVWLLFLQVFKHDVDRVLEVFIVLPDFHGVDEFDQGGEVPLFDRGLVMDISDQGAIEKCLRLVPERIVAFSFAFCVRHKGRHQLQDVFFTVDIVKGIVFHALFEIDGIEDGESVMVSEKAGSYIINGRTFGALAVKMLIRPKNPVNCSICR